MRCLRHLEWRCNGPWKAKFKGSEMKTMTRVSAPVGAILSGSLVATSRTRLVNHKKVVELPIGF